jgi:manganese transport protein
VFSTVACLVLQEASARITVVSGSNLGQALVRQYGAHPAARGIPYFVMGAIILGCAAFEAGNILGAVAGLELVSGAPRARPDSWRSAGSPSACCGSDRPESLRTCSG